MNQTYKKRSSPLCWFCDYLTCKSRKNGKKKKCKWYTRHAKKYESRRVDKEPADEMRFWYEERL